ncbi:MAG: TrmH family RNA methyltransferase [Candidatus Promineifilaceae bacterium]
MTVTESLTSLQNPRVKHIVRLRNRRQRDDFRQTVVEGEREVARALAGGVVPLQAFVCPTYAHLDAPWYAQLLALAQERRTQLFDVSPAVYDKMVYRSGSGGVLLLIPYLARTLDDLGLGECPLLVVIDGVEKPGNLGAILRTADAAGISGLLLTGSDAQGTDLHNPNTIRASLGAVFSVPVVSTRRQEALEWLREHDITTVATSPDAIKPYTAVPYDRPLAVVMGSEAVGLDETWLEAVNEQVRIPMAGVVDSLNLSVSTAVLLYEIRRQRELKGC